MSLFYLFTFAISLWYRKFVTADITAMFVNHQHGIQQRAHDYFKHTNSAYTVTRIEELKLVHLECYVFAFTSISVEYLQKK